jgi:hypothetical protein
MAFFPVSAGEASEWGAVCDRLCRPCEFRQRANPQLSSPVSMFPRDNASIHPDRTIANDSNESRILRRHAPRALTFDYSVRASLLSAALDETPRCENCRKTRTAGPREEAGRPPEKSAVSTVTTKANLL